MDAASLSLACVEWPRYQSPPDWTEERCETETECSDCLRRVRGGTLSAGCLSCFVEFALCAREVEPPTGEPFFQHELLCDAGCYPRLDECMGFGYWDNVAAISCD